MTEIVGRFPMLLPICRDCGEPGLHGKTDECIQTLQAALIAVVRRVGLPVVASAEPERDYRGRAPQWLRRDRCDLPKTIL